MIVFNGYFDIIVSNILTALYPTFVKNININIFPLVFYRYISFILPIAFVLLYKYLTSNTNTIKTFLKNAFTWQEISISSINLLKIFFTFLGFYYLNSGTAISTFMAWPIFATIFSVIFIKEKITFTKGFGVIVAFIGVLLVNYRALQYLFIKDTQQQYKFYGLLSILLGAIAMAIIIVFLKKQSISNKNITPIEQIYNVHAFGTIIITIIYLLLLSFSKIKSLSQFNFLPSTQNIFKIIIFNILIEFSSFYLLYRGLKYLSAIETSTLSYIQIIAAMFFGYFISGELITSTDIFGSLAIMLGIYLVNIS